jgi:hypothetical protein
VNYLGMTIDVSMTSSHTLKATFIPTDSRVLIIQKDPLVGFTDTTPSPGTYTYVYTSSVQVTASASGRFFFVNWNLDGTVRTENPINLAMNLDHRLIANFDYTPPDPPPPCRPPCQSPEPVGIAAVVHTGTMKAGGVSTTRAVNSPEGQRLAEAVIGGFAQIVSVRAIAREYFTTRPYLNEPQAKSKLYP